MNTYLFIMVTVFRFGGWATGFFFTYVFAKIMKQLFKKHFLVFILRMFAQINRDFCI